MNKKAFEKKVILYLLSVIICIVVVSLGVKLIHADSVAYNFCCEKTRAGAWCQNGLQEFCDANFRSTPTSCDATSFCKLGCCVDSEEGLCMENTPQKVCEVSTGTWLEDAECNVAQCELGCCILGDQASFVTLTRCKRLSGVYGLETNFKRNIADEATCIIQAHLQDKGACVYESDNQKTCKFTTRQVCLDLGTSRNISSVEFWKDYLCSNDELATNCGPTTQTICLPGKDEVYFKDSCGNPANIYDSSKTYNQNPDYWRKIVQKDASCGFENSKGNAGSKSCGNCDYFKGSICGEGNANLGDNICKDLNCYDTQNGKDYKNGESWCVYQSNVGEGNDVVGSRHFRHVCINGEETIEACADFRNEICIEDTLETSGGEFTEAGCRVNRWQDCLDQDEEDDCLNTDKRDCYWKKGLNRKNETSGIRIGGGICLPKDPAGLKFWDEGDASVVCSLGNAKETVYYEKGLFTSKKCVDNCEALGADWVRKMNEVCVSIGDCGAYVNIANRYTSDGVEWKIDGTKKVVDGILSSIKTKGGVK